MGRCRDCRYWNGATEGPAICTKMPSRRGGFWETPKDGAMVAASNDVAGPLFITGPDFGCAYFSARRETNVTGRTRNLH